MPSEQAISRMMEIFTGVIDLGGTEERTAIVPNLSVIDAAPSGLTNFIIVQDDRDGDNILAKTVPGVVYANSDKVNVLFIRGAEPIAFQMGSESPNAGLWEIVPSTSTDIFYDKGNVIVGSTPSFTRLFNVVSAAGGALVGIEGDNAGGDVTALLANLGDSNIDTTLEIEARQGTRFGGKIVFGRENALAWATAANADGFISFNPVLNNTETERVRITSDGNVGIGDTSPNTIFSIQESQSASDTTFDHENTAAVSTSNAISYRTIAQTSTQARVLFEMTSNWNVTTDATRTGKIEFFTRDGGTLIAPITIIGANVGITVDPPLARLHVDQTGAAAAIPVLYLDQGDNSEEMIEFNGTIGVGNAIEAVGAKTLTTTHFIKVTLPGSLTRYFPVGTIA